MSASLTPEAIREKLVENEKLIKKIIFYRNSGRQAECAPLEGRFESNLRALAPLFPAAIHPAAVSFGQPQRSPTPASVRKILPENKDHQQQMSRNSADDYSHHINRLSADSSSSIGAQPPTTFCAGESRKSLLNLRDILNG